MRGARAVRIESIGDRGVTSALVALTLSACGETYEPGELRENRNEVAAVTVPALSGGDADVVAAGEWERTTGQTPAALSFTEAAGAPIFRIACDDRGGVLLERLGVEAIAGTEMMEVRAGKEVARLAVNQPEAPEAVLRAAVPFNHPLLAPLAARQGQLSIAIGEGSPLTLPLNEDTAALAATCRESAGTGAASPTLMQR
jgi:hypothetical protein